MGAAERRGYGDLRDDRYALLDEKKISTCCTLFKYCATDGVTAPTAIAGEHNKVASEYFKYRTASFFELELLHNLCESLHPSSQSTR